MTMTDTKITAEKNQLVDAITRAVAVTPRRAMLPSLSCCKLSSSSDGLDVSATDLTMAVTTTIEAKVSGGEPIAANARDLLERVKAMPSGELTLTCNSARKLSIKSKGTKRKFTLTGIDPADLVATATLKDPEWKTAVTGMDLASLISQVTPSVSLDTSRVQMNGALLECSAGQLRMVATNGASMAVATLRDESFSAEASAIIPQAALTEIKRMAELAGAGTVEVSATKTELQVTFGTVSFRTRLTDAQFPPYGQVIPEVSASSTVVIASDLVDAIKAASLSSADVSNSVSLSIGNKSISVESSSPENGEASDEVACETKGKEQAAIGVASSVIVPALQLAWSASVSVEFGEPLDPIVVRDLLDDPARDYLCVAMPMRL